LLPGDRQTRFRFARLPPDQVIKLRLGQFAGRELQGDGVLHDGIEADDFVRLD